MYSSLLDFPSIKEEGRLAQPIVKIVKALFLTEVTKELDMDFQAKVLQ